jgi:hypothetical protein
MILILKIHRSILPLVELENEENLSEGTGFEPVNKR